MGAQEAGSQRTAPDREIDATEEASSATGQAGGEASGTAKQERTDEVTAAADEMIDEIDNVLLSMISAGDEELSEEEFEERAEAFLADFQQKNGQ